MTTGDPSAGSVYHLELRQFPHNMCRFNLDERELRETILVPWAQERWVEFGERKWSPHQATLTVLRGPHIPFGQLTMGRGWRTAQRSGQDVTEELLAAVRGELAQGGGGEPTAKPPVEERPAGDLAADSLGLELLGRLGSEPAPLRFAWELAAGRDPEAAASAALALAEGAVESLLRARLVELVRRGSASGEVMPVADDQAAGLVRDPASWASAEDAGAVRLRRV